jgi:hypothetical protein
MIDWIDEHVTPWVLLGLLILTGLFILSGFVLLGYGIVHGSFAEIFH